MDKKLGHALKSVVGEVEATEGGRARKDSPLLNANRLRIFQYLCRIPCSHLRSVAEGVSLGTPTVAWHLDRLVRDGLVRDALVGRRRVFYPANLVPASAVPSLHAATDPVVRDILLAVMARPGLAVGELAAGLGLGASSARRAVKTLVSVGLLDQVRDGRYWRYFPGDTIASLSGESRARVREFKRSLVRDLQQEGLEPEVDVSPRGESVIAVSAHGSRVSIVIPDDPFESILVGQGGFP